LQEQQTLWLPCGDPADHFFVSRNGNEIAVRVPDPIMDVPWDPATLHRHMLAIDIDGPRPSTADAQSDALEVARRWVVSLGLTLLSIGLRPWPGGCFRQLPITRPDGTAVYESHDWDFVPAFTGGGGFRLYLRWLSPLGRFWGLVWAHHLEHSLAPAAGVPIAGQGEPGLDLAPLTFSTRQTVRIAGQHPKTERWSIPLPWQELTETLTVGDILARSEQYGRALCLQHLPDLLPIPDEPPPHVVDLFGRLGTLGDSIAQEEDQRLMGLVSPHSRRSRRRKQSSSTTTDTVTLVTNEGLFAALTAAGSKPRYGKRGTMILDGQCPACGRHDHARVSIHGWLRCFAASCPAHRGLPPDQWAPTASARAVQQLVPQAIHDAQGSTLLTAPGGARKTRTACAKISTETASGRNIIYGSADRNARGEVCAQLTEAGVRTILVVSALNERPTSDRHRAGDDGICWKRDVVHEAMRKGYSYSLSVCRYCFHDPLCRAADGQWLSLGQLLVPLGWQSNDSWLPCRARTSQLEAREAMLDGAGCCVIMTQAMLYRRSWQSAKQAANRRKSHFWGAIPLLHPDLFIVDESPQKACTAAEIFGAEVVQATAERVSQLRIWPRTDPETGETDQEQQERLAYGRRCVVELLRVIAIAQRNACTLTTEDVKALTGRAARHQAVVLRGFKVIEALEAALCRTQEHLSVPSGGVSPPLGALSGNYRRDTLVKRIEALAKTGTTIGEWAPSNPALIKEADAEVAPHRQPVIAAQELLLVGASQRAAEKVSRLQLRLSLGETGVKRADLLLVDRLTLPTKGDMLALDATGSKGTYELMLGRELQHVQVPAVRPGPNMRICRHRRKLSRQVVWHANKEGVSGIVRLARERLLPSLEQQLLPLTSDGRQPSSVRILVFTFQRFKDDLRKEVKGWPWHVAVEHWGGVSERATNMYLDYDVVVLFGVPRPPPEELAVDVSPFYLGDPDFDMSIDRRTGCPRDPRLAVWWWEYVLGAVTQAAARVRSYWTDEFRLVLVFGDLCPPELAMFACDITPRTDNQRLEAHAADLGLDLARSWGAWTGTDMAGVELQLAEDRRDFPWEGVPPVEVPFVHDDGEIDLGLNGDEIWPLQISVAGQPNTGAYSAKQARRVHEAVQGALITQYGWPTGSVPPPEGGAYCGDLKAALAWRRMVAQLRNQSPVPAAPY